MTGIKPTVVNKHHVIQFVLNPESIKFQIDKSNISKISFSLQEASH